MFAVMQTDRCRGFVCFALAVACLAPVRSEAQAPAASNPYRTVNLNYVYAADLGFGGYSLSGLTADVYTLPLSYTLHDLPAHDWNLRLLVPVQAGIYSFHGTDVGGEHLQLAQQSVSVVPGVELEIPAGSRSVVKPFAQFGVARVLGDQVGNAYSWIYLAGARALTQWHDGATTLSLGNAVVFAGDNSVGPGGGERYVSLQLGGEVRHPLGFSIGNVSPDIGIYVADYYYPAPLTFSRFLHPPLNVSNQAEIGFSVGLAKPYDLLGWSNPRIGAGFVFGGGLDVWHVNFGFQF
jgi:hypothetical protein